MDVYLRSYSNHQKGRVLLTSCRYKFGCRQVAIDENYQVKVFNVPRLQQLVVTLLTAQGTTVALVRNILLLSDYRIDNENEHLC